MADRLFDRGQRRASHGATRALVHVPLDACPTCSGPLHEETIGQPALLRHGGHGAMLVSVRLHCPCGWTLLREQSELRPPRTE